MNNNNNTAELIENSIFNDTYCIIIFYPIPECEARHDYGSAILTKNNSYKQNL